MNQSKSANNIIMNSIDDEELFSLEDLKIAYGPSAVKMVRKRKMVLIIEDDFYFRSILSELLARDFEVIMAEDGEKGCAMAAQYDPDLILLDMRMPKLGGKDVLKKLREKNLAKQVPIIIVSGSENADLDADMATLGVRAFFPKNFQAEDLLSMVFSVFGQKMPRVKTVKKSKELPETPAILLFDGELLKRDQVRTSLRRFNLITLECETVKQLQSNFRRHSKIFDGVIYDSHDRELAESSVIQDICSFLKIPCISVEDYLRAPEKFDALIRRCD